MGEERGRVSERESERELERESKKENKIIGGKILMIKVESL